MIYNRYYDFINEIYERLDQKNIFIVYFDPITFEINNTSDNFTEITGYTKEEVSGFPYLFDEKTCKKLCDQYENAIEKHIQISIIIECKKKNGDYFLNDLDVVPLFNENFDCHEIMLVNYDLNSSNKKKNDFLHDLYNIKCE